MTELAWQQARLIPTSGINGAQEQERRATSALLAVMTAVKEYGRTLTKGLVAHADDIETYIEVEFDLDGKKVVPDGLIRVSRGSRVGPRWSRLRRDEMSCEASSWSTILRWLAEMEYRLS
jgi:hypothetical protein